MSGFDVIGVKYLNISSSKSIENKDSKMLPSLGLLSKPKQALP